MLSDDKVRSMLSKGTLKSDAYRVIYQSQVIPRLTIGYVYNLPPDIAAKVSHVMLKFQNEGGGTDETTGTTMRFFPIDYKKDFEFVRTIDDYFDPRINRVIHAKPAPPDDAPKT